METVLAEKFESIIARGLTNTRMRDFYDIYILTTTQSIDINTFRVALRKTAEKRHTSADIGDAAAVTERIFNSPLMIDLWGRYRKKYIYAADVTWEMAIGSLQGLQSHGD